MHTLKRALLAAGLVVFALAPVLALPSAHLTELRIAAAPAHPTTPSDEGTGLLALPGLAMAIRIKDTGALAKKFVQRASAAGGEYTEGVKQAGSDWEGATRASEENYKVGVTQAANDGRFGRGVAAAGAAKYVNRASTLGAQRYPSGVAAAEGEWAKNTQPHLDAMKSMELPPRRPKGDPANMTRAQAVAARNRAIKLGK